MMSIITIKLRASSLLAVALLGGTTLVAPTAAASELGDVVARIDFGFYTREPRMIEAARSDLERRRALLERARAACAAWRDLRERPAWGRAETLTGLAQISLELGARREARDFIEQALIEAPDYDFALELGNTLSLPR